MHLVSVSQPPSSSMDPRNNPHIAGYYQQQQPPPPHGYAPHPQYPNGYPPHPQAAYGSYQQQQQQQQPWGPAYPGYDPNAQAAAVAAAMGQHQQQHQQPLVAASPAVRQEIISPHGNDVLMGRGGKNNQHKGNENLSDMARLMRDDYKASAKKGKSDMSRDLVQQVRDLTPPGRFLKRNPITNDWEDVGDDIAREKISQVLRDAVSEHSGPKAAAKALPKVAVKTSSTRKEDEERNKSEEVGKPAEEAKVPKEEPKASVTPEPTPAAVISAPKPALVKQRPVAPAPRLVSTSSLDMEPMTSISSSDPLSDDIVKAIIGDEEDDFALAMAEADDFLTEMDSSSNDQADTPAPEQIPAASSPPAKPDFQAKPRRPSMSVPVQAIPWKRIKRKNNMLDRYANMNMGLSNSDMSIGSLGSQLSSRNLGTQLSSRQLMSTGARQMSSRQLSSRQLSTRQLSSRQLSGRQLGARQASGRQMMSADRRKQAFAMMGESDLSLESLSISGMSGHTNKSRSRKNVFMQQYQDMDMGLSDFSLQSLAGTSAHPAPTGHCPRPSVIIEGDLEEFSDHGSAHAKTAAAGATVPPATVGAAPLQFMENYAAAGIGVSSSNMTINTIGTFSGHSRMSRGLFSMGQSMRMDSARSFLTTEDLQLDMLDDELFDEFALGSGNDFEEGNEDMDEADEFSSDFC